MEVLICSGDRDAFQLVDDKVTLLYPVRGVSEVSRMTPAAVTERYGVAPDRYSDLAALVGESSRQPAGDPWGGAQDGGEVDHPVRRPHGLVAHVDTVDGQGRRRPARRTSTSVLRNRRLNQLVRDVPLG